MTGSSSLLGEESFLSLRRIEIGNTGDALYLVTAIPTRTVWQWANYLDDPAGDLGRGADGRGLGRLLVRLAPGAQPSARGADRLGRPDHRRAPRPAIPFGDRSDEMGAMSRALDVFRQNAVKLREAEAISEQEALRQAEVVQPWPPGSTGWPRGT